MCIFMGRLGGDEASLALLVLLAVVAVVVVVVVTDSC